MSPLGMGTQIQQKLTTMYGYGTIVPAKAYANLHLIKKYLSSSANSHNQVSDAVLPQNSRGSLK